MLKAFVTEKKWDGPGSLSTEISLLRADVVGAQVEVLAKASVSAKFRGKGACVQNLKVESIHPAVEFHLRVSGRTIYVVGGEEQKTKDWIRACVPVYFLELCFTAGGTIKSKLPQNVEVSAWAAGTVSVYIAEAGVRSMGVLIDAGLNLSPRMVPEQSRFCLGLSYFLRGMRWEYGFVWRARGLRYNRRRRWYGSVSFSFGAWRYVPIRIGKIENPIRVSFWGEREASIAELCTDIKAVAAGIGLISSTSGCTR